MGNERWANTHFSKLPESSAEFSRARFATMVTRLRELKDPGPEIINDFLELSKDTKLTQDSRNEALLAVGRLRYERKDFQGALEAYQKMVFGFQLKLVNVPNTQALRKDLLDNWGDNFIAFRSLMEVVN